MSKKKWAKKKSNAHSNLWLLVAKASCLFWVPQAFLHPWLSPQLFSYTRISIIREANENTVKPLLKSMLILLKFWFKKKGKTKDF